MQADITGRFVLLAQLEKQTQTLARVRAAALYALVLGALLLLFAGSARPAQPLAPFIAGGLMGGLAMPMLLISHLLLKLRQDAHRGLVRHLFRRGHRVDYPEFPRDGERLATPWAEDRGQPNH